MIHKIFLNFCPGRCIFTVHSCAFALLAIYQLFTTVLFSLKKCAAVCALFPNLYIRTFVRKSAKKVRYLIRWFTIVNSHSARMYSFFYFITHKKKINYRNCFTWNINLYVSTHYPIQSTHRGGDGCVLPRAPSCRFRTPCPGTFARLHPVPDCFLPGVQGGWDFSHYSSVTNSKVKYLHILLTLPNFACIIPRFCAYTYMKTYIYKAIHIGSIQDIW